MKFFDIIFNLGLWTKIVISDILCETIPKASCLAFAVNDLISTLVGLAATGGPNFATTPVFGLVLDSILWLPLPLLLLLDLILLLLLLESLLLDSVDFAELDLGGGGGGVAFSRDPLLWLKNEKKNVIQISVFMRRISASWHFFKTNVF